MRHLVLSAPGNIQWSVGAAPSLRDGRAALVRPVAAATCDFDHLLVSGMTGFELPVALGHELVGVVVKVGSEVESVCVGDLVVVPFQISCGRCHYCRRGLTSACSEVPWLSCYGLGQRAGDWGSALSDLVSVPYADGMLVRLPGGVSARDAAAVGCNVSDAYRCVAPQLDENPGAAVLVMSGAFASIGLYTVAIARALGASRVDFFDRDPRVAEKAARLGANVVESPEHLEACRYPITVDASMNPSLLAAAIDATAPGGVCTVSTMYPSPTTELPLIKLFERCATLRTGQPHTRALVEPVLELIARGALEQALITDDVVDWEDAPDAFRRGRGKVVCTRSL